MIPVTLGKARDIQVKIVHGESGSFDALERNIRRELDSIPDIDVLDIKYGHTAADHSRGYYSAMILYRKTDQDNDVSLVDSSG